MENEPNKTKLGGSRDGETELVSCISMMAQLHPADSCMDRPEGHHTMQG